jgi:RNA polymerase sigma-70 factor (ECF subfamily)
MDKRLVWFEELYDTHADAVWRHFYYRLGDDERAKELMQEVFLKVWQYIQSGKEVEHEKAFIYRIAKNLFINEIRKSGREISLEVLEESGFDKPDESMDTSTYATEKELLDRLTQIKDNYRIVLIMRYVDDLSVKDIAHILGEKETNISMRIKRGIEALKETYKQHPQLL